MAARATTTTISTVIVDDEQLASEELLYLLKTSPMWGGGTGSNGYEAFDLIEKLEPDLVFMDVQMPGMDGLSRHPQTAREGNPLPYFILATAFDQYAIEAFAPGGDGLPAEADRKGPTGDDHRAGAPGA